MYTGPNISRDGLLFGTDMGTNRFFKGKHGTNITTGVNLRWVGSNSTTYQNGKLFESSGYTETVNIPALGTREVRSMNIYNVYSGYGTDGNFNCCPSLFEYGGGITVAGGTTYTYQIIYKCETGYTHPNFMYHYQYGNSGYITEFGVHDDSKRVHLGDGWYHAWNTFTTNAAATYINTGLWYYQYNIRDKVSVAAVSISLGADVRSISEFIPSNTTRSVTDVLIDQTRRSTVDVTNASYDNNGRVTFDGTNDYVSISPVPLTSGQAIYSIEAVFRTTTTKTQVIWEQNSAGVTQHQRACMILLSSGVGGFNGQSNDFHSSVPYSINTWYHWVITVDENAGSNQIKIYVNGSLYTQGNTSAGASNLNVGTHGSAIGYKLNANDEYFAGQIPVVRIYNRLLQPDEISLNFSGYKRRFNI
jgi:hypothetical protein